ncbi:MAG: flagellar motor protein MotA [Pseudomonadota bacterium]|nr:flagellar motor protein MotA [Pseudomonadota bacterium]
MTKPQSYLIRMFLFIAAVFAAILLLLNPLHAAFFSNAVLNSVILGVLLIGIFHMFRLVLMLRPEVVWIESFRREGLSMSSGRGPRLLAPMATMLGERSGDRWSLSTVAMRSLLDGIATRLDEGRETARYFIGLLVFLGLLGTFWGLLDTVRSIGDVISGLTIEGDAVQEVFERLKGGLRAPLAGMGTAFSSSLFGLAGSLVLGFLALQAGQAQNRFYNDLEEWLSGQTRLGGGGPAGDGDQAVPAYIQALLEQTADNLENLQRTLARGEESRIDANRRIVQLTDNLGSLNDSMRTQQELLLKLAQGQSDLRPLLAVLAEAKSTSDENQTSATLRNIETHLARMLADQASGREDAVQEIRNEIRLLARTIAALAEGEEPR